MGLDLRSTGRVGKSESIERWTNIVSLVLQTGFDGHKYRITPD